MYKKYPLTISAKKVLIIPTVNIFMNNFSNLVNSHK